MTSEPVSGLPDPKYAAVTDHERIWLQSDADADPHNGRMWCHDKVWPDDSEYSEPTEYVRADIHRTALAQLDEARAALEAQSDIVAAHVSNGDEGRDIGVMRGWLERIAEERRLRLAAEARLEELTRERDEARQSWKEAVAMYEQEAARVDPALSEIKRLAARLEEAKAVLGPFAEYPLYESERDDAFQLTGRLNAAGDTFITLKAGDLRRARAFLHQGGSDAR